jgi:hypothetical protein
MVGCVMARGRGGRVIKRAQRGGCVNKKARVRNARNESFLL